MRVERRWQDDSEPPSIARGLPTALPPSTLEPAASTVRHEQRSPISHRRSQRLAARSAEEHVVGHGHDLAGSRVFALRILRRRRGPDQSGHRPGGHRRRSAEGAGAGGPPGRRLARLRRAGRQFVERRRLDLAGAAGGGQGVPHPAGADRRPAGGPGAHQPAPLRPRRKPPPRQPGDRRGRRHRRRGHHQPGGQSRLHPRQGSRKTPSS